MEDSNMATEVVKAGPGTAWRAEPSRLSWGAIFGGAFVTLGVWVLLYALGLAIGFTAIDPQDPDTLRGAGIGTGIWSVVVPLIALFVGGMVAARTSGPLSRRAGALHGAVLWGLTTILGVLLIGAFLTTVIGGVARAGAGAVGAAPGVEQLQRTLGLTAQDLIGPVNQQLQEQGMPPITVQQLELALQDAANTAFREGRFDQAVFVDALAQNTNLNRAQAQELIATYGGELQQQLGAFGEQVTEVGTRVFWAVFFALLLGLVASMAGGALGVNTKQRLQAGELRAEERPTGPGRVIERTPPPTGGPAGPPREVYP
jgi:FAD/FMN-containing dehydrogenase